MKQLLIYFSIFLFSITLNGQSLRAYFSYSVFNTPQNEPYIETYLTVNGSSVDLMQLEDGTFQGKIDVQIIFKIGDSIVNYSKYDLAGPIIKDTLNNNLNMLDIQRYGLSEGEYNMELTLRDAIGNHDTLRTGDKFVIDFPNDEVSFSDVELLSSYEKSDSEGLMMKNGFLLTPYVFNYFPQSVNTISFYSELYNSKKVLGDESFLLTYYIRPFEADKKLDQYIHRKKVTPKNVIPILSSFDITQLPSGNYLLVLEARNRNNELLNSRELFFQRFNPSTQYLLNDLLVLNTQNTFVEGIGNRDTLSTYIEYLTPISTDIERVYASSQLKDGTTEELQKYFLNFWIERDKLNPKAAWEKYFLRVKQANKNFKSVSSEGYKTDRGRVYLQYEQPNIISEHYFEPAAYPYEIWHYYQLGDQRDKKFVFYSHDNATNDFQLIHSNAVGELSNYRWETVVYRRTWDPNSIDDAVIPSSWGSKATESYIQPW